MYYTTFSEENQLIGVQIIGQGDPVRSEALLFTRPLTDPDDVTGAAFAEDGLP